MTRREHELLIAVALAVSEMASPNTKRHIDRAINNLQDDQDECERLHMPDYNPKPESGASA
jgi:hypothetical protein